MVSESLARKFKPAGFEQPEGSRYEYTRPRPELQEAFYRWVDELDELPKEFLNQKSKSETHYTKAVTFVEKFGEIPYIEANSLLADFKPKTGMQINAGLFISACYNQSPERVIIFDLESPEVGCIGYRLRKDKILINTGKTGMKFGSDSSGAIFNSGNTDDLFCVRSSGICVNNGNVGDGFGYYSSGIAVNNAKTGESFGSNSSGIAVNNGNSTGFLGNRSSGIVLALIEPGCPLYSSPFIQDQYGNLEKAKLVLKPSDIDGIPELKEYLEELSETTKAVKDEKLAKQFLEKYGQDPKESIEREIKEMLRKGGFEI